MTSPALPSNGRSRNFIPSVRTLREASFKAIEQAPHPAVRVRHGRLEERFVGSGDLPILHALGLGGISLVRTLVPIGPLGILCLPR